MTQIDTGETMASTSKQLKEAGEVLRQAKALRLTWVGNKNPKAEDAGYRFRLSGQMPASSSGVPRPWLSSRVRFLKLERGIPVEVQGKDKDEILALSFEDNEGKSLSLLLHFVEQGLIKLERVP